MTRKEVSEFEKLEIQLKSLHEEVSSLSKKSQNDSLNKFKLKLINTTISNANGVLGDKYKPYSDFEQFDDNDIPSNSDAAIMIGQYLSCMEKLRADNVIQNPRLQWVWKIDDYISDIRTTTPKKIIK